MLLQKYKDMAMETPRGQVALAIVRRRWDEWDKQLIGVESWSKGKHSILAKVQEGEDLAAKVFFEALWRFGVMEEPEGKNESYEIRRLDMWLEQIFFEEALNYYQCFK